MTIQTIAPYLVGTVLVVSLTVVSSLAVKHATQTGLAHENVAQTVNSVYASVPVSVSTPTLDSINARKSIGYKN